MSPHRQQADSTVVDLVRIHWRYRKRWIAAVLAIWGIGAALVLVDRRPWEASQGIVLQIDALTSFDPASKLQHDEARKNSQETLLELSLSRSLLRNALLCVGAPAQQRSPVVWQAIWPVRPSAVQAWPPEKTIEDLRNAVTLTPPKGAEFGKTDVLYLKVKDRDRQRALALVATIGKELEKAYGRLRAAVAQNTLDELQKTVALAQQNLADATQRMRAIEKGVGEDLIALRMLDLHPFNEIALYRTVGTSVDELRQTHMSLSQHAAMLMLLQKAKGNPETLQAGPSELITAYPSISRLIQGLSDARLRSASLASRLTEADPEMAAARREEAAIRREIHRELDVAISGVTAAHELTVARRELVEKQLAELQQRVDRISNVRAEYASIVKQVEHRRTLLETTQGNLAHTRAIQAAASQVSMLSRLDDPDGGVRPVGPSRSMVALLGMVAGLIGGSGLVFLTAPIARPGNAPAKKPALHDAPEPPPIYRSPQPAHAAESNGNGHGARLHAGA